MENQLQNNSDTEGKSEMEQEIKIDTESQQWSERGIQEESVGEV